MIKEKAPEVYQKLRTDYEVCILNHGKKQEELDTWVRDYWK